MAVVIRPTGEAALYGQAAKLVGESEKAQRDIVQSRRTAERLQDIQARQQLGEFQRELDLQREQRSMVFQIEKEERSRQWEMEKMEIRSRADFAEREQSRQVKRADFKLYLKSLEDSDVITEGHKERLRLQAVADFQGIDISDRILFPELYQTGKQVSPIMAKFDEQAGGVPTRVQLEAIGTEESFDKGVELGYWPGPEEESTITNPVTGLPVVRPVKKSSEEFELGHWFTGGP